MHHTVAPGGVWGAQLQEWGIVGVISGPSSLVCRTDLHSKYSEGNGWMPAIIQEYLLFFLFEPSTNRFGAILNILFCIKGCTQALLQQHCLQRWHTVHEKGQSAQAVITSSPFSLPKQIKLCLLGQSFGLAILGRSGLRACQLLPALHASQQCLGHMQQQRPIPLGERPHSSAFWPELASALGKGLSDVRGYLRCDMNANGVFIQRPQLPALLGLL